jgi:hypothetical protein
MTAQQSTRRITRLRKALAALLHGEPGNPGTPDVWVALIRLGG